MNEARPAETRAQELAAVAAETAKCAGFDVTITPCPEVIIQVGSPPQDLRCWGVKFDEEYLLVRLPTGGWRAVKIVFAA